MTTSIIDSEGHDFLGPGGRAGTYFKVPKAGVYQFVINSIDALYPGPYHFVFQGGKLATK